MQATYRIILEGHPLLWFYMQVQVQNDGLHLLLNSEDITDTIPATNNTNTNSTLVYLQRSSEASILSLFSNGISITVTVSFDILSFVATIPEEYQGLPSGLLGNFNGDNSDDLMFANGTIVEIDSPYSLIHEFGQSCKFMDLSTGMLFPPCIGSFWSALVILAVDQIKSRSLFEADIILFFMKM